MQRIPALRLLRIVSALILPLCWPPCSGAARLAGAASEGAEYEPEIVEAEGAFAFPPCARYSPSSLCEPSRTSSRLAASGLR